MLITSGCVATQPSSKSSEIKEEVVKEDTTVSEIEDNEISDEETKTLSFDLPSDWERFPDDPLTAMYGEYVEYGFGVPIKKMSLKNYGPGTEEDAKKQTSEKLQFYLEEWGVEESSSGMITVEGINVYYFNYLDVSFDLWNSQIYFSKEGFLFGILMSDKVENYKEMVETVVFTLKLE